MNWKTGSAVALAGVALGLGGCVEFQGQIKGKQISKDEVRVKFKICDDLTPECNPEPTKAQRGESEVRVLIAFRAPKGTDMPKDFAPKDFDVDFTGSSSYTDEMNSKAPGKPEEKWHGYISENIADVEGDEAKFKLILGLPRDAGKTFKYRPVVGYVNGPPPTDTVTCAENVQDSNEVDGTDTVCVDDPETPEELQKSLKIELD